jgi:hypothetical protein
MHHQWTHLQAGLIILSIGGMLLWYIILSPKGYTPGNEYLYVGFYLYNEVPIFWFFGFFSIVFFTINIDAVSYYLKLFLRPDREMLFRQKMNEKKMNVSASLLYPVLLY